MGYVKEQAKAEIEKLVEDFKRNKSRLQNQAEAQIENNFIRPLFKYLNWNTTNEGLAVADYEFVVNRTSRGGKRPDYTLQLDGQHLLVMDAKQVKYDMHDSRWLNQVYAYGYSTQNLAPVRRIDFAVLTDFEEFVVLDCTLHVNDPKALRNFLVLNWTCDDFVNQFDQLWDLFERENMRRTARTRNGDAPRGLWALALSPRKVKANRMPPDKAFLADMDNDQNGWRVRLAKDMKKLNPAADGTLITAAVQLLIDRLIFVKALSDREIEDDYLEQLAETVEKDGLAESDNGWFIACRKIFEKLDRFYNGSIFKPRPELEAVTVANKTVRDIIRSLQPENSPYNFAVLPVEILGTIYERFLGRVVRTTEQRVKIEEKPEVRKAGGVYYTPQYIVEYIVKNTVGKLLDTCKTPVDAAKLKILDPACGSGSFLVGAYAVLIDWHIKYYDTKKKLSAADRADAYYDSDGRVRLTARLKRQILINNLFGVDIDQQAVEVTRFSLSLKALEDTRREELYEERSLFKETVLPDLNNNIKCGNSLIGPDYFSGKMFPDSEELRRVNPFDWQREFPDIFPKWEKNEAVTHGGNKGLKPLVDSPLVDVPLVGGPLVDKEIDSDLWFVTFVTHNSRVSERMVTFGVQTGEPLIFSPDDQDFIKETIFAECKKEDIVVIAMNVLPDHVHMVIAAIDEVDLTEKVRKIKGYSSHAFQRSREWPKGTEHVWAQKFNSRLIENDEELAAVIHYVQNNHLKHAERWGEQETVNKGHIVEGKGLGIEDNKGLKPLVDVPLVEYSSGFDAVIGNPPYVRQETLGDDFKSYVKEKYDSYAGTADLYVYFIEQSLKLLREYGHFGFICSNKWMRSNYGHPLRDLIIKESKIEQIIDFGELPVFQGAATFPAILLLKKEKTKEQHFIYAPIKRLDFISLSDEISQIGEKLSENSIKGNNWTLASSSEVELFEKMRQTGIPLGEYVSKKIYRGILSGLNEAFVIDHETRDRLISEDKKNVELIKPLICGDDVRKCIIHFRGQYIILIPKGWTRQKIGKAQDPWDWFHKNYPAIASHMEPFALKAQKRQDKGDYWWELRACDYYEFFEKPKIVYPDIAKESRMTIDYDGLYFGNTVYFIPIEDLYLLGVLNSSLIFHYFKRNATVIGDADKSGRLRWFSQDVLKLPIRKIDFSKPPDKQMHDKIVQKVKCMLDLNKKKTTSHSEKDKELLKRQIDATDREIDTVVYELYGLTKEEIAIVEG